MSSCQQKHEAMRSWVLSEMDTLLKITVPMLNRDKFVGNILCCSHFGPFLVRLQRRWLQRLPQRTDGPPLDRSGLCKQLCLMPSRSNGVGSLILPDVTRLNGRTRADVCISLYIVNIISGSLKTNPSRSILVPVFSGFLVPSCDFHILVFRS